MGQSPAKPHPDTPLLALLHSARPLSTPLHAHQSKPLVYLRPDRLLAVSRQSLTLRSHEQAVQHAHYYSQRQLAVSHPVLLQLHFADLVDESTG